MYNYITILCLSSCCPTYSSLGYSQGIPDIYSNSRRTSELTSDIILDDVICNGQEMSVMECRHQPLGTHDCDATEKLTVVCGVCGGERKR